MAIPRASQFDIHRDLKSAHHTIRVRIKPQQVILLSELQAEFEDGYEFTISLIPVTEGL